MPASLVGHPRDTDASGLWQPPDWPAGQTAALDLADFERLRQLQAHVAWLRRVMPTAPSGSTRMVPMLSGPEIVSSEQRTDGAAGVRSSLVFSVPVYGPDQAFKGRDLGLAAEPRPAAATAVPELCRDQPGLWLRVAPERLPARTGFRPSR